MCEASIDAGILHQGIEALLGERLAIFVSIRGEAPKGPAASESANGSTMGINSFDL